MNPRLWTCPRSTSRQLKQWKLDTLTSTSWNQRMLNAMNAGSTDISPGPAPTAKDPATTTPTSSGTRTETEVEVVVVAIVADRPAEIEDVDEAALVIAQSITSKAEKLAEAAAVMEEDQGEAAAMMDEDQEAAARARAERSIR